MTQQIEVIRTIQFSNVVVLDELSRVLLVCENDAEIRGLWSNPGGGSEPGEFPIQSAKRELYEETGLTNLEPNFVESFLWRGDHDLLIAHVFVVRVDSSVVSQPVASDEIQEIRWFDRAEFEMLCDMRQIRSTLTKLFVETAFRFVSHEVPHSGEPT